MHLRPNWGGKVAGKRVGSPHRIALKSARTRYSVVGSALMSAGTTAALILCSCGGSPSAKPHGVTDGGTDDGDSSALFALTEFPLPVANCTPSGIAVGGDGNLWFTEIDGNKIGRITTSGTITEFALPTANGAPADITAGPDGALWFTEEFGNKIGRITTAGATTEFAIPTAMSDAQSIVTGADGNLWFIEETGDQIGRVSTSGVVTEFPISDAIGLEFVARGPDGNVWFTESSGLQIDWVTPSGVITALPTPAGSSPVGMTVGSDSNLWFGDAAVNASHLDRIDSSGTITAFSVPSSPYAVTTGPDGNLWFTVLAGQVGSMTLTGDVTMFAVPGAIPDRIVAGPDGALWFTESGAGKIGRLGPSSSPMNASGFVGIWQETTDTTMNTCDGVSTTSPPAATTFDIAFQADGAGGVDLITLNQSDVMVSGSCVTRYSVNGSEAILNGPQTCASGSTTITWTQDDFSLSGDGMALEEMGTSTGSNGCTTSITVHYVRKASGTSGTGGAGGGGGTGGSAGTGGTTGACAQLLACCNAATGTNKTACMAAYDSTNPSETACGSAYTGLMPTYCP
jgi:streptogramin lyase